MESMNWAPEHSDALRDHLAKGLSFSEIVKAINSKFSTSYSRNAALGRARRMGLTRDDRRKPSLSAEPANPQSVGDSHSGESRTAAFLRPVPVFETAMLPKLRCVEVAPRHLSVTELEHGDCRYPYGGDEEGEAITFCGHPRRPGSSYCTPHFHLSREPAEPAERVVSTAALRVVDAMEGVAATHMAVRLMPLPRGHRIAHLRALIGLASTGSQRRDELSGLLRDELSDVSAE
jgi:GcrA cell cycle regulator